LLRYEHVYALGTVQNRLLFRQKLLVFASQMLENKDATEDVVQEVLLRLWTIREQLDSVANPAGFAIQTTKNICIDRLRTWKQTVETEDPFSGTNGHIKINNFKGSMV
jgi:DNA-directed RNA polymerase specialized sigma24 family protein